MHHPHQSRFTNTTKRKMNLIIPIYNLTTIKPANHYQSNQKLRTIGHFQHGHPITGILGFYHELGFPIQSKSLFKMFRQTNLELMQIKQKATQIARCLPHTMYGLTLSCFSMGSDIFNRSPKLLYPYSATIFL